MAKSTKTPAKSKKAPAKISMTSAVPAQPRRLKHPKYQSFHLRRRIKPAARTKLPPARKLFVQACVVLGKHWKLFGGMLLIYAILNIILVGGIGGNGNLQSIKDTLGQAFTGHFSKLSTGLTLFAFLVSSAGSSTSSLAGAYQTMLLLLMSLVIIWALRQIHAKANIRIRDPFYSGVYPLVPFILVLCVIGLQLLPLVLGVGFYSIVVSGGIAVYALEKVAVAVISILLAVLSLYMICSSLFALYIVTLPGMTPMKALRSARQLVANRRWIVLRKILFLPIGLLVAAAIIMVPLALFATPAATVVFFLLTIIAVAVVHSYMYALYRGLLSE